MTTVSLLGANGTPLVELGGARAWLTRTKGDIVCSFQWIDLAAQGASDDDTPAACMVLYPAARRTDVCPYVIPQRNAWRYANSAGQATPHCVAAAFVAACDMGFPDRSTVHRIVDVIVDGLADLIRMPSEQPADLHVARVLLGIEARATVNGRTLVEEAL